MTDIPDRVYLTVTGDRWIALSNSRKNDDAIEYIRADIIESKWISVKDRVPKRGETVIGYDEYYGTIAMAHIASYSDRLIFAPDDDDCHITYWQPRPEEPLVD